LSSINAAAESPAAIGVGAIVHKAIFAEEALSAESFYVNGYSIAWLYIGYFGSHFFHHTYHFVAYGNTRNGTRHASVLDM
jgi:hypothetical protein